MAQAVRSLLLAQAENRYAQALELAGVMIVGLDPQGRVQLLNREAERVTANASSGTEDLPCDFSEFLAQRRQLSTDEASSLMLVVARPVGRLHAKRNFCEIDATVALLRATNASSACPRRRRDLACCLLLTHTEIVAAAPITRKSTMISSSAPAWRVSPSGPSWQKLAGEFCFWRPTNFPEATLTRFRWETTGSALRSTTSDSGTRRWTTSWTVSSGHFIFTAQGG